MVEPGRCMSLRGNYSEASSDSSPSDRGAAAGGEGGDLPLRPWAGTGLLRRPLAWRKDAPSSKRRRAHLFRNTIEECHTVAADWAMTDDEVIEAAEAEGFDLAWRPVGGSGGWGSCAVT